MESTPCEGEACRTPTGDGSTAGGCTTDPTGVVTCGCAPGLTGPGCDQPLPVAGYQIDGAFQVLELGQSTILSAEALGVGQHDELVWQLVDGGGTLIPMGSGLAQFVAPSALQDVYGVTTITVGPACCASEAATLGIGYKGPAMPWVTGVAKPALKPVDQSIMRFMYDRCTGGLVLGLNWKGIPLYRRGYGRTKGRSTPGRVGVDCGAVNPVAGPVYPDAPVRIGSNTKSFTAAMLRRTVGGILFSQGRLPPIPAQADAAAWLAQVDRRIESVRILDAQVGLVPKLLRDILGSCTFVGVSPLNPSGYTCTAGTTAAPVTWTQSDVTPPSQCGLVTPPSCYNGGTCQGAPGNATCKCLAGFSGSSCRILNNKAAARAPNGVDSRWQQMTLGHVLMHQAGLPRSNIADTTILSQLFALRAAHDPNFVSLEDVGPALHDVNPAFPAPAEGEVARRVLEDRPSSFEYLLAETGRNLYGAPGTQLGEYSNLGFVMLGVIVETLSGDPNSTYGDVFDGSYKALGDHLGSPVEEFVAAEIGGRPGDLNPWGATRSGYGMWMTRSPNPTEGLGAQVDPEELEPRDFTAGAWNPPQADAKGIICDANDGATACDFSTGEIDGYGNAGLAQYGMHGTLMFASAGGLVTESELFLRFMGQHLTGYGQNTPNYGRRRFSWSESSGHSGLIVGGRSMVQQIGWRVQPGDPTCNANTTPNAQGVLVCSPGAACCGTGFQCVNGGGLSLPMSVATESVNECVQTTSYRIPTVNATNGDYNPGNSSSTTASCVLPEGLDIFVTANQTSDGQDVGGSDYDFMIDAVVAGLCQVDWAVSPAAMLPKGNNIQAAP